MSITQRRPLAALAGGSAIASMAALSSAAGNPSLIEGSVVYNTAPFVGYTTTVRAVNPFTAKPIQIVIFTAPTVPQFELRDNQVPNAAGVFIASPGNVGIVYRTDGATGVHTFADLDTLINTSTIIQVATNSTNPTRLAFAGYVAATGGAQSTGLANVSITAPTQGTAVYVPDFARRVRVMPAILNTAFSGLEYRATSAAAPVPVSLDINFYDDYGQVQDVYWQGVVLDNNSQPAIYGEPAWLPVPASATMLAVYPGSPTDQVYDSVQIHWRIAP